MRTGVVQISVFAADIGSSGLLNAEFRARWSGEWLVIGTAQDVGGMMQATWDLCQAGVPDGAITLRAQLTDKAGNTAHIDPDLAMQKRFACGAAPAASVALAPTTGAPGSPLHAAVSGFAPGESVSVSWQQGPATRKAKHKRKGKKGKGRGKRPAPSLAPVVIGSFTTSPQGEGSVSLTVPGDSSSGSHTIDLLGNSGSRASTTFTVVSTTRAADGSASSNAPATNAPGKAKERGKQDKRQHGKSRKERKRKHSSPTADRDHPNGRDKKRGKRGERHRQR